MAKRGVLYMVWGDRIEPYLERSRRSLAQHHPELPVEVVRIIAQDARRALLEKSRMMSLSPFNETLFLDADTVVLGRLDFGFEKAARHGVACCINECPWARRFNESIKGDVIEYNTGVLFFKKSAKRLFEMWERLTPKLDSAAFYLSKSNPDKPSVMPFADQCAFAVAVEQTGFVPFVLPLNWNFRPGFHLSFFGPLKIWHGYPDPPPALMELARYYEHPDAVFQHHRADEYEANDRAR